MKYVDEYRDRDLILSISGKLKSITDKEIVLMEVCGGHTMAIHRFGLNYLLPQNIHLLSGPGCPICVSSLEFIDLAIEFCRLEGTIITTYGDLIRVPGSTTSLEKERGSGRDIGIIYTVLEALHIAQQNLEQRIIFPGIGFETPAPSTAVAIINAKKKKLSNFFILSAHKVMPPVMKALVKEGIRIDGFIAPGHVSAITGTSMYDELVSVFKLGVVVSGFEPVDLMQSILMLALQIESNCPQVEVQYNRVVKTDGNANAKNVLNEVFQCRDDIWRGLGMIPESGLRIRDTFSAYDAEKQFDIKVQGSTEPKGCICGDILRGMKTPPECALFAETCTPSDPVGACMVSGEGTCATYYRYRS